MFLWELQRNQFKTVKASLLTSLHRLAAEYKKQSKVKLNTQMVVTGLCPVLSFSSSFTLCPSSEPLLCTMSESTRDRFHFTLDNRMCLECLEWSHSGLEASDMSAVSCTRQTLDCSHRTKEKDFRGERVLPTCMSMIIYIYIGCFWQWKWLSCCFLLQVDQIVRLVMG